MRKRKLVFLSLLSLILTGTSCSNMVSYALDFKIITSSSYSSLSLINYYEQFSKEVNIKNEDECEEAFLHDEYDVIICDAFKGMKLIKEKHVPYKLERLNTWGNLYLIGKENISELNASSKVVSFNRESVGNKLFLLSEEETEISAYFTSAEEEYNYLLNNDETDYALLPEPYVTKLLDQKGTSYQYLTSVSDLFKEYSYLHGLSSTGYSHYPETALFVSATLRNSKGDAYDKYLNFLNNYDRMQNNLSRANGEQAVNILYYASHNIDFNVMGTFNVKLDKLAEILEGKGKTGTANPFGYCSYNTDIDSFYTNLLEHGADLLS